MKFTRLCKLATLVPAFVSGIELAPRSANPSVVSIDIQRRHVSDPIAHETARLLRRQEVVEGVLKNVRVRYIANLTLGTPPQSFQPTIDTGSADFWVNVVNSTLCSGGAGKCVGGTYDPDASSTSQVLNDRFYISYIDDKHAIGNYMTDSLSLGGVTVDNFQFGTGLESTSNESILGIGYVGGEVQTQSSFQPYPNLPQALVDAGRINRNAYSLWLNDLDASTGTILFGGVNRAKYQGTLATIPIVRVPEHYNRGNAYNEIIVAMSSIGLNGSSIISSNLPCPVYLDTGYTVTVLPDDIVRVIFEQVGILFDEASGLGIASCDYRNINAYIEFGFSGVKIKVPFNELFFDVEEQIGKILQFKNGTKACLFGIAPANDTIWVLGDTFLRSAYAVFDLERNEVSLAQTVYNATTDDVREIASGTTAAVPGAVSASEIVPDLAIQTATDATYLGLGTSRWGKAV